MPSLMQAAVNLTNVKQLSKFIEDPKAYVASQGLDPDDPDIAAHFELYAKSLMNNINATNRTVGLADIQPMDWGIGAGCCSKTILGRP